MVALLVGTFLQVTAGPSRVSPNRHTARTDILFSFRCWSREDSRDGAVEFAPRLGNSVALGAYAVLLGNMTVGDDTKIAFSVRLEQDTHSGVLVICKSLRQTRRSIPER